jgi:hypothetical protein
MSAVATLHARNIAHANKGTNTMNDVYSTYNSGEKRCYQHACAIAEKLEQFSIHAIPADAAHNIVRVVIVHETPDRDARDPVQNDGEDGPWEESLLYEGRQIPCAVARAKDLDPAQDDKETALAVMRTAQDVDTWL